MLLEEQKFVKELIEAGRRDGWPGVDALVREKGFSLEQINKMCSEYFKKENKKYDPKEGL